jgi:hypothetical protein
MPAIPPESRTDFAIRCIAMCRVTSDQLNGQAPNASHPPVARPRTMLAPAVRRPLWFTGQRVKRRALTSGRNSLAVLGEREIVPAVRSSRAKSRDLHVTTWQAGSGCERSRSVLWFPVANWRSLHFGRDDGPSAPHVAMSPWSTAQRRQATGPGGSDRSGAGGSRGPSGGRSLRGISTASSDVSRNWNSWRWAS